MQFSDLIFNLNHLFASKRVELHGDYGDNPASNGHAVVQYHSNKKQLRGQGVSYLRHGMSKTNERHKQADDGRAKGGDQLVNSVAKVLKGKEGFFVPLYYKDAG